MKATTDCYQRYSSDLLWHFTGYEKSDEHAFDILKRILLEHNLKWIKPRFSLLQPPPDPPVPFGYISLCDIPFKDLHIHISKYKEFGIGFKKSAAIVKGFFNPVMYVQYNHFVTEYIKQTFPHITHIRSRDQSGLVLDDFLAKPSGADGTARGAWWESRKLPGFLFSSENKAAPKNAAFFFR